MRTRLPPSRRRTEGRRRLSRGSLDVQTLQRQPIMGTPTLVPEPSTRIDACSNWSSIYSVLVPLPPSAVMMRGPSSAAPLGV
jgi:hypothetical protein